MKELRLFLDELAGLFVDDVLVMRAAGLRIRAGDLELPEGVLPSDEMGSEPGTGELAIKLGKEDAYNDIGVEIRFVEGGFQHAGPGVAWVRLRIPVAEKAKPRKIAVGHGNGHKVINA